MRRNALMLDILREPAERRAAVAVIRRILAAGGALPEEGRRRLARVEALFGETKLDSSVTSELRKLPAAQ